MLDSWPTWARDLVVVVLGALLTYVGTDLIPQLQGQPGLAGLLAVVLTMAVAALTPWLTRVYGIGSKTP